jgi:hypothetical protein
LVALPTLVAMIQNQNSAWERSVSEPLGSGED